MKCYMYILRCSDHSLYVGSTRNLEARIKKHNKGKGANYTRKRLPVKLIYYETFHRIDFAFNREKQIQRWSRAKKEALVKSDIEKLVRLSKTKCH